MDNLEQSLNNRMNAYFQNVVKKDLLQTAEKTNAQIQHVESNEVFEKIKNRLNSMQTSIKKMSDSLMKVGNDSLEKFSDEISDVEKTHKEKVENNLKELIVNEIQELIKIGATSKFRE